MSAETAPDHLHALAEYLKADEGIAELVAGRVYFPELPAHQTDPPLPAIVLSDAGGTGMLGNAYQRYGDRRVDVRCWARTPNEARAVCLAVTPALKQLRRFVGPESRCLVHWARPAGGPLNLRDPDTRWPYTLSVWQILVAEVPAPA